MNPRRFRLGLSAVVLTLVTASCSGDATSNTTPQTTAPLLPTPTTVPAEPPPSTTEAAVASTTTTGVPPLPEPQDARLFHLASDEPVVRRSDSVRAVRYVAPGAVTISDGLFHMLSGGIDRWPGESSVAYYTSLDGTTWSAGMEQPVLHSSEVALADPGSMGHSVVRDSRGRWVMYFHTFAGDDKPGFIGRVSAPSPLGPWTADAEPVLAPGPQGAWDSVRLARPQVVDSGRGLMMFYSGVDDTGAERIGLATSIDGETWLKHNDPDTTDSLFSESDPVLVPDTDWEGDRVLRPAVTISPDGFVMMYQNGLDFGMAFSGDGITWEKPPDGPVVTADDTPSWAFRLFQGSLVYNAGTYFFYVEAGNEQGADVFLLLHDGLFRDPAAVTGTTVETVAPEIDAATGGVALDASGNLYVADIGTPPARDGSRVYRVSPEGDVTLFASDPLLLGASGNAVAPDGTLYQSAYSGGRVTSISPDGTVTTFVDDGIQGPVGIVVDPAGDGLFVADCTANTIVRVDATGNATMFAADPLMNCPNGLTIDEAGNLYVANFVNGRVLTVSPEGDVTQLAVVPGDNNGHIAYANGVLYVAARGVHQIYELTLDGDLTLFAGSGQRGLQDGFAIRATFSLPNGIAVAPDGTIYVNHVTSDAGNVSFPTTVRVIRPG